MATLRTTNLQHPSAASPNIVLAADGTITGLGIGNLVAVKHALFTGTQSASVAGGGNVAVTSLSIAHTMSDAANRLIISAYLGTAASSNQQASVGLAVADDGTLIGIGDAGGSRTQVGAGGQTSPTTADRVVTTPSVTFVYEPGDINEHTYTVRALNVSASSRTLFINSSESDTNTATFPRGTSGLVIQEVRV